MAGDNKTQRIARLTPLSDVLARIDALVRPVEPRPVQRQAAVGRVLAEDVVAPAGLPTAARALRDGFAVRAETTADASAYAPAPLSSPQRVDVGDILPPGADAVAPLDVVVSRDGRHEAVAPVAPGEGVLAIDADIRAGTSLRRAGERLRAVDEAVLAAAGVENVMVRAPRVCLVQARAGPDRVLEVACALIARAIIAAGGSVQVAGASPAQAGELAAAFGDTSVDAVIAIGGTGSGRDDASVLTLARLGRVEMHGIALSPGETAAFGFTQTRPVLLIPGRVDAALAVWVAIGSRMLARLSGSAGDTQTTTARLTRKVASPLGLMEIVPVRIRDGAAEPMASGYWPLEAIARADGWILVTPESEGYPTGAEVVVRPWP
jgi:molybdopterin molybdotransferase